MAADSTRIQTRPGSLLAVALTRSCRRPSAFRKDFRVQTSPPQSGWAGQTARPGTAAPAAAPGYPRPLPAPRPPRPGSAARPNTDPPRPPASPREPAGNGLPPVDVVDGERLVGDEQE